jgi:hypothetical protein
MVNKKNYINNYLLKKIDIPIISNLMFFGGKDSR